MKSEYNISTLKRRGHPLREKVKRGEIKLLDPFDISEEEFQEKIKLLDDEQREYVLERKNRAEIKDETDNQYILSELKNFLDESGRLKIYPAKRKQKILSLFYLASKFEKNKIYSQKEVNQILRDWHLFDDWAMLRRDLYDKYFLGREPNGSAYWLEYKQPTFESFGYKRNTTV
jgi:hypothetical protein